MENQYKFRTTQVGSHGIFLSVILTDSVFKMGKKYYPQVFYKNANIFPKKKKISRLLQDQHSIYDRYVITLGAIKV